MGNETLISLAPNGVEDLEEYIDPVTTNTLVTIGRNTVIGGTLGVVGTTTLNGATAYNLTACNINVVGDTSINAFSGASLTRVHDQLVKSYPELQDQTTYGGVTTDFSDVINRMLGKITVINSNTSDGAPYTMKIPSNFASTNVVSVYSHGYRFGYSVPPDVYPGGYVAKYTPESAPQEYANTKSIVENFLLNQGIAVIGSAFSENGFCIKEAIATNAELIQTFKSLYPSTSKVIAWGDSLGSSITQGLAETHPSLVDVVGLMDFLYNPQSTATYASDVVWGLHNLFDSRIISSGYSLNVHANSNQALVSMSNMNQLLTNMYVNYATNPTSWEFLTNLPPAGEVLRSNEIPPAVALQVLGMASGVPLSSGHFGGNNNTPCAIIENILSAGFIGIGAIADLELRCGGRVYDNTTTQYSSRSPLIDIDNFSSLLGMGYVNSNIRHAISNVLRVMDDSNMCPRVHGTCNVCFTNGTLHSNTGRITKPTILMSAQYDPITVIGNVVQFESDYLYRVAHEGATPNLLKTIIGVPPVTTYARSDIFDGISSLGTGHENYTNNNYILVGATMVHAAQHSGLPPTPLLADGVKYTDSCIITSNLAETYPAFMT